MTTSLTAMHNPGSPTTSSTAPYLIGTLITLSLLCPLPGFGQVTMPQNDVQQATEQEVPLSKPYYDGNYTMVANQGLLLLLAQPWNHELRLFVANSLAWTGRTDEAITQYQALAGTQFTHEAQLGLANVYRWSGRPDRAQPLYQHVLNDAPDNKDAMEGLTLAQHELRSKTTLSAGNMHDSDQTSIHSVALKHQWRNANDVQQFEIEANDAKTTRPQSSQGQSDLTFRYANPDLPLEPKAEISLQTTPDSRLFGKLSLTLSGTPLSISAGRVNWGKMAQNPTAIAQGLTSTQAGVNLDYTSSIGRWRASYLANNVSDSNLIQDSSILFTPAWQPFTSPDIKAFVGVNGRNARFASGSYWSPTPGNYYAVVGVNAEWVNSVWTNVVAAQYGVPFTQGLANSWSISAGAHRYLGQDWAIGIDLSAQSSQRSTAYSAQYLTFSVEKLW